MLSAESHRGNREASGWESYGRFLYNGFRYYDPNIGRYISADPIGQFGGLAADGVASSRMVLLPGQAPLDPLRLFGAGTNLYWYASNNPTHLIDPTGEFAFTAGFGAAGAAIGALANLGFQLGRDCGFDQDEFFNAVAAGALAGAVAGLVADTAGVAGVAVAGSGAIGAGTLSASGAAFFGAGAFALGFDFGEQVAENEGCECDE